MRPVVVAAIASLAACGAVAQCPPPVELRPSAPLPRERFGSPADKEGDVIVAGGDRRLFVFERVAGAWEEDVLALEAFQADLSGDMLATVVRDGPPPGRERLLQIRQRTASAWDLIAEPQPLDTARVYGDVEIEDGVLAFGLLNVAPPSPYLPERNNACEVHELRGGTWLRLDALTRDAGDVGHDSFGSTVDVDGGVVAVSAPFHAHLAPFEGAVHVFRRAGDDWLLEAELSADEPPAARAGDALGNATALSGDVVIAQAPGDDNVMGPNAGAAYVFRKGPLGWTQEAKLLPSTPPPAPTPTSHGVDVQENVAMVGGTVYSWCAGAWDEVASVSGEVVAIDLPEAMTVEFDAPGPSSSRGVLLIWDLACRVDLDCDGLVGDADPCPQSPIGGPLRVRGVETGLADPLMPGGCTLGERLAECEALTPHGAVVSCAAGVLQEARRSGAVDGRESGLLQSRVARGPAR